ncbi:hypothetical protein GCM10011381_01070 [Klenkia taihuensis]|nr:hypothetical protein GCM10011381_01070 [Klenkia taihuensis]
MAATVIPKAPVQKSMARGRSLTNRTAWLSRTAAMVTVFSSVVWWRSGGADDGDPRAHPKMLDGSTTEAQ